VAAFVPERFPPAGRGVSYPRPGRPGPDRGREAATLNGVEAPVFVMADLAQHQTSIARLLRRLPPLSGRPIRLHAHPGLADRHGPVHAGSFLRERRIAFDCRASEFPRIFVHELFHFVWLRLGNPRRLAWEELMRTELALHARGELGWSAEWRKGELTTPDLARRTRRWHEYCCESFCDTAAWRYASGRTHPEFTLAARHRQRRHQWWEQNVASRGLSI
jgi:hypothetical protein